MPTDRKSALARVAVSDFFHATSPNGASLICRTLAVNDTMIQARTVTSQYALEFDREAGVAMLDVEGERVPCTIDSTASIPDEVRTALLGLDDIYSGKSRRDEGHTLTERERRALVFAALFYPSHPVAQRWEMMSTDRKVGSVRDPEDYDSLTNGEKLELVLVNYLIPKNRPKS